MMLNSVFVLDAAGGSPVLPDISGMLSSLCKAGKRVSLSQLAAGLAGSLAAVVLFGWMADISVLKSLAPGFVATQPWTATDMGLGAAALALASRQTHSACVVSSVFACALAVAAGLPIAGYVLGQDFGTDLLLLPRAMVSAQSYSYPHPGRMALATAVGLEAMAVALLLAPRVQRQVGRIAFSLSATVALIPVANALFSYAARLDPVFDTFHRSPVALHTALGICALAIGTLALRRDVGWVRFALSQGRIGWTIVALLGGAGALLTFGTDAALRSEMIARTGAQVALWLERCSQP